MSDKLYEYIHEWMSIVLFFTMYLHRSEWVNLDKTKCMNLITSPKNYEEVLDIATGVFYFDALFDVFCLHFLFTVSYFTCFTLCALYDVFVLYEYIYIYIYI